MKFMLLVLNLKMKQIQWYHITTTNKWSLFLVSVNYLTICYMTEKKNMQTTHERKKAEKEVYVLKWFWPGLLWSFRYSGYLNLLCHQVSVLQYYINRNMSEQRCLFYSKDWNIGPDNNHQYFENLWMHDYEHILRILGKFQALSYFLDFSTNCKISDVLACCRYTCNLLIQTQPNGNSLATDLLWNTCFVHLSLF